MLEHLNLFGKIIDVLILTVYLKVAMAFVNYEGPSLKLCSKQEDNEKRYLDFLLEIVNVNPGINLNMLTKLLSEASQELLDLYGRSKQSVKTFLNNHPDYFLCKNKKVFSVRSQNLFLYELDRKKNNPASPNLLCTTIVNDEIHVEKELYNLFEVHGVISILFPTFGFIRAEFSNTVFVYFDGASFEGGKQRRLTDVKLKIGQKVYFSAKRRNAKVGAEYRAVLVWRPENFEYFRNREKPAMYICEEFNSDLLNQWNEGSSESPVQTNFTCVYGAKGSVQKVFDDFGFIKWHNEELVFFDMNCLQTNEIPVFNTKNLLKPGQEVVFDAKATENQRAKWEATTVWLDVSDFTSQNSLVDPESDEIYVSDNTDSSSNDNSCEVDFSDSLSIIETQKEEKDIHDKCSSWKNWETLENQTGKIHPKLETEGIIIFGKNMTEETIALVEVVYIKGSQAQNLIRDVQDGTIVHFDAIKDKVCGGTWKASLVWIGKKPKLNIPNPLKDKTALKKLEEKYLSREIKSCSLTPDISEVLRIKQIVSLMSTTATIADVENKKTDVSNGHELDKKSICTEVGENMYSDETCSFQNCTPKVEISQNYTYDNPAVKTKVEETYFKSRPFKNDFQSKGVQFSGEHTYNNLFDNDDHYTGSQCVSEVKTFTQCNKFSSESLKEDIGLTLKMPSIGVIKYSMIIEDKHTMNFSKPKLMQYFNLTGTVKLIFDYFANVYIAQIERCLPVFWTDLYVNRERASELYISLKDILNFDDPVYFNYIEVLSNCIKWGRITLAWIGKKPQNVDKLNEEEVLNEFDLEMDSLSDINNIKDLSEQTENNTLHDKTVKGMPVIDTCTTLSKSLSREISSPRSTNVDMNIMSNKKISCNSLSYKTASESRRIINSGNCFHQNNVSDFDIEVSQTPGTKSNSDLTALNTSDSGNDTKYAIKTPRTENLSDSVKYIEVPETVSQLDFGSNSSTLHTLEKVNLDNVKTDLPLSSVVSTNYMLSVEPTKKIIHSTDSLAVTNCLPVRDSLNGVPNTKNDSSGKNMLKNEFSKMFNNTTDFITRDSFEEIMKTTTCSSTKEPLEQVTNTTTSLKVGKSSEMLNNTTSLPSRDVAKEMRKSTTSSSANVSLQQGTNNTASFLSKDLLEKVRKPTTSSPPSDSLDQGTNTITSVPVRNSSEVRKATSNSLTNKILGECKLMNTKFGLLSAKLSENKIDITTELPKVNLSKERSKTLLLILSKLDETHEQVTSQDSLLKIAVELGSSSDHPWFSQKDKDNFSVSQENLLVHQDLKILSEILFHRKLSITKLDLERYCS